MDAASKYTELRTQTSALFKKVGALLADFCEGSSVQSGAWTNASVDSNLGSFHETFSTLQARQGDQNLTVAVLALTKSGKSTLLNSLIGANCLPANNVPETARITRITHTLGQAVLVDRTREPTKTVTGEEEIKAYLRHLNSEARSREHLLTDETYLDLQIPIAALQGNFGSAAAQTVTIRLLDTPGPNEAGEIALKAQVERLLDSVDAVIYLLDYTKLKTADEAEVLQRLKDINPQLIARLSQRLFFVVNKADMIETSEGMGADETKEYVAHLITSQMRDESFQLSPDQVLLVSAQHALLSRLVLQGKADREVSLRFGRLAFGSRARKFSPREHKQAAEEMLTDSGVAELEERVLAFLYAHSGSLKLLALLDDTVRMLSQIKNVAAASNAALQHDVASLQKETQEMQSRLERSLESFDTVHKEAQAVEGEVVDEVQQRMQRLKEKLFRDVSAVLEPSRLHPPGRWQEAWQRAARFLNRRPGHSPAHKQELQNRLYELHAAISSSIEAEVRDFWQDIETATNERQRSMFQCINRRLESLSREIEATVGQVLDLRLEPVTIAMDPPAAQDFHESLQNLFAQGITEGSVTRSRRRQESYTVWEPRFRNGLCRTGQYFVGRPANRPVTENYQQPVYDLQPQHIKDYFIALVDGTIDASVKYVREYVHAYLNDVLEDARSQIEAYGQSFNATMQAALYTKQQGEEAQTAALAATQARTDLINNLLQTVAHIQCQAEALCPGQRSISDVISEFDLDEPESSQAVHAAPEQIQLLHAEPAVLAEPAEPVLAVGQPGHDSSTASSELLQSSRAAEPVHNSSKQSAAAAGDQQQSPKPAVAKQESPLPAMMTELREAMAAPGPDSRIDYSKWDQAFSDSDEDLDQDVTRAPICGEISNASTVGAAVEPIQGLPLDEETELELALLMSKEEKDRADRAAAQTAEVNAPPAPPAAAAHSAAVAAAAGADSATEVAASAGGRQSSSRSRANGDDTTAGQSEWAATAAARAAAGRMSNAHRAAHNASSAASRSVAEAVSAAEQACNTASSAANRSVAEAMSATEHACNTATAIAANAVQDSAWRVDRLVGRQMSSMQGLMDDVDACMHDMLGIWPAYRQSLGARPRAAPEAQPDESVTAANAQQAAQHGAESTDHQSQAQEVEDLPDQVSNTGGQAVDSAFLQQADEAGKALWEHIARLTRGVESDESGFDLEQASGPAAAATASAAAAATASAAPVDEFAALTLMDAAPVGASAPTGASDTHSDAPYAGQSCFAEAAGPDRASDGHSDESEPHGPFEFSFPVSSNAASEAASIHGGASGSLSNAPDVRSFNAAFPRPTRSRFNPILPFIGSNSAAAQEQGGLSNPRWGDSPFVTPAVDVAADLAGGHPTQASNASSGQAETTPHQDSPLHPAADPSPQWVHAANYIPIDYPQLDASNLQTMAFGNLNSLNNPNSHISYPSPHSLVPGLLPSWADQWHPPAVGGPLDDDPAQWQGPPSLMPTDIDSDDPGMWQALAELAAPEPAESDFAPEQSNSHNMQAAGPSSNPLGYADQMAESAQSRAPSNVADAAAVGMEPVAAPFGRNSAADAAFWAELEADSEEEEEEEDQESSTSSETSEQQSSMDSSDQEEDAELAELPSSTSPRTQMHSFALGGDLFHGQSFMTAHEGPDLAAEHEPVDLGISSESDDEDEGAAEPASIHVEQETDDPLANNRLAALSGHGQLSQEDSSDWEIVSSDVDDDE